MATLELWTQSVTGKWPPSLRFYDKKLSLLHALQDQGLLKAFRNREREIAALIEDRDHQLELEPDGLSIKVLRPQAKLQQLEDAGRMLTEAVEPGRVSSVSVALQYLASLPDDYLESRSYSAHAFLGLDEKEIAIASGPTMHSWDWAVLLEGETDRDDATFQVEFGIVDSDEIPERFAREAGQVESFGTHAPAEHWEEAELPNVALFADWTWSGAVPEDLAPFEAILQSWSHAREDAEHLLSRILSRMEEDKKERVGTEGKGEAGE